MIKTLDKRRVIRDDLLTVKDYHKLIDIVYNKLTDNDLELTQQNIIKILRQVNVSNTTIARVINNLISGAKATRGSVASQINFMKRKRTIVEDLFTELEKEFTIGDN